MTTPEHDDETGRMLKAALTAESDTVSTDPTALQRIQQRTDSAGSRWRWPLVSVGAGLATAAAITAVVLVGGGGDVASDDSPAATQPTTVAQSGMHQGVYDPEASSAAQAVMYYVGPMEMGSEPGAEPDLAPRLYTEPHTLDEPGSDPAVAAVREFLTSRTIDPDYQSGWPEGVDVTDITSDGGVTMIALEGDVDLGTTPSDGICLAGMGVSPVQAMLRTAGVESAAAFTYNGEQVNLLFGCADVAPSVAVQGDDEFRSLLTIDSIVEGQSVSSPVTVTVTGNTFEGTIAWQLLDASGSLRDESFVTTTTGMGTWGPATIELGGLDPGTYTIRCFENSPMDGKRVNVDDKSFTVQ